jgi:DUF1009 family protein
MSVAKEFWIKNMVCNRCIKVITQELQKYEVPILSLELGRLLVEAKSETDNAIIDKVIDVLNSNGFEIVQSENENNYI